MGPRLKYVANNPFDAFYVQRETGMWNLTMPIIRPMGADTVPVNQDVANDPATKDTLFVLLNYPTDWALWDKVKEMKIPVKELGRHYGGAKTLAFYRAHIFLPYQCSVMKMIENLAAGVPTLIPAPEFYKKISVGGGGCLAPLLPYR
jgi:hypothetical protein